MNVPLEDSGRRIHHQSREEGFDRMGSPEAKRTARKSWRRKYDRIIQIAMVDKVWYQYRMWLKGRYRAASKTGKLL